MKLKWIKVTEENKNDLFTYPWIRDSNEGFYVLHYENKNGKLVPVEVEY